MTYRITCTKCQFTDTVALAKAHRRCPKGGLCEWTVEAIDAPRVPLGDWVAAGLKAVGIKPCQGCKERQAKLNRLLG